MRGLKGGGPSGRASIRKHRGTGGLTGVRDGRPHLSDGRVLDVANVVWCTGFHNGLSWIDLPIFDAHGEPRHREGTVDSAPGLYFVGLHFLYAMSSTMIHGVGRDARRIVQTLLERQAELGAPDQVVTGAAT